MSANNPKFTIRTCFFLIFKKKISNIFFLIFKKKIQKIFKQSSFGYLTLYRVERGEMDNCTLAYKQLAQRGHKFGYQILKPNVTGGQQFFNKKFLIFFVKSYEQNFQKNHHENFEKKITRQFLLG